MRVRFIGEPVIATPQHLRVQVVASLRSLPPGEPRFQTENLYQAGPC